MLGRIEATLNTYCWTADIENAGTPGGAIVALEPIGKSARHLLKKIQILQIHDKYSEGQLYANSSSPKGGLCDYDSDHLEILTRELQYLITGINKAVKRLEIRKRPARPRDEAAYILKNLFRIFEEYRPGMKLIDQESLFAGILDAVNIPCPDIIGNPTRFRSTYGIRS